MPSLWLLEGFPGVVLISLSRVTAFSEPLQVGVWGTPLLVDCGVARNTAGFGCGTGSSVLGFTIVDMSPPNCIGCNSDLVGQGSRVGCDNSGQPLVSSTVVSGNNSLTNIQFAGRAVTCFQLLVLLFLFHLLSYVRLQYI